MSFNLADVETIYAEDPKLKRENVKSLSEWVEQQPHLPEITELQVILFLHSCYYDMEAAKTTIENYFTLRTNSDLFHCATEEMIKRTLSMSFIHLFPKKTPEGDVVLLMRLLDRRPEVYVCLEHLKVMTMLMSLYFHQYGPANGMVAVFDMEGAALGHLTRINLSGMKQLLYFVQLKFHYSYDSFYECVPKKCLPKEYGGDLPDVLTLQEGNVKNLMDNLDFFKWHDNQKVDESKKVLQNKNKKSFFSLTSAFKKLEFD
ncbi:retinol-binding protein pinta-like isoform X2 [Tenebrio molitor]|uniref:retinol-binding protein pinta-like isoform X2 n=1 Tax=Tenebrio molitor TaxID=7067 RepID=UPI0036247CFD